MSQDSWTSCNTTLSPLSVQTFDDSEDMDSCSASSDRKLCLSIDSDCSLSDDAADKLKTAHNHIIALPSSSDRQLMLEVYGK